jgi:hypothetical protein
MFFNHPSRAPKSASAPALTLAAVNKAAPSVIVGFEGAPGHQRSNPLGSYPPGTLIDRWDPVAAQIGGVWDQWLGDGLNVWGAIANSDFHHENDDFWPCEFASTRVYAPDRTGDGVIKAIRAGSFFAEHGHIVDEVELRVRFDGGPRPAGAGETVSARAGAIATVSLGLKIAPTDYLGRANRIDTVELIGVTPGTAKVIHSGTPNADGLTTPVTIPPGGIVLRARGRRSVEGDSALMFYTNPVRITAPAL